jgi:hypothetical protein
MTNIFSCDRKSCVHSTGINNFVSDCGLTAINIDVSGKCSQYELGRVKL